MNLAKRYAACSGHGTNKTFNLAEAWRNGPRGAHGTEQKLRFGVSVTEVSLRSVSSLCGLRM